MQVESGKWKTESGILDRESLSSGGDSLFSGLSLLPVSGYEIHQGQTEFLSGAEQAYFSQITDSVSVETKFDGAVSGNVFGTYIHGLFDEAEFRNKFLEILAARKGIDSEKWSQIFNEGEKSSTGMKNSLKSSVSGMSESTFSGKNFHSIQEFKESQYNLLAETLRKHLDMKKIYEIMGLPRSAD